MKRLLIYDLDGTLADTSEDILQSVNYMLGMLERRPLSREAVVRFIGLGLRTLVASCLQTDEPRAVEQGMERYREHYGTHLLDHTTLYPSVRQMLERFKDRTQAVLTNKPNPFSQRILDGLGVAPYFQQVLAGDSGLPRKPDPTGVRTLLATHGIRTDEAVLIGDSPVDVETGRNAGIQMVAVTQGFSASSQLRAAAPDAMVQDVGALLTLATQEGW